MANDDQGPANSDGKGGRSDGLLRLSYAIASDNLHTENRDLIEWLEAATVDDLRLAYPILLNWCRNSTLKTANSQSSDDKHQQQDEPTTEEVVQKIVDVLWNEMESDCDEESKLSSVSALRMSVAGYLHTNNRKMRGIPLVSDLEKRTKARLGMDRAATNTLNMVNLASQSPLSMSQYIHPDDHDDGDKNSCGTNWGFPQINIDLGLGLQQSSPADVCEEYIREQRELKHPFTGEKVGRMRVKKVFPSKRKPVWIEYFSADGENRPLKPDVLAKQGDDLRNDSSVTSVSRLCEDFWAAEINEWKLGVPPTVCAYDVLVTASDAGYLEMVPGKNFLDLSQKKVAESATTSSNPSPSSPSPSSETTKNTNTGWDDVDVRKLAPSLVGSYIVNFVLGVRDRHEDNMMVVGDLKDDPKMMQIDFGYVLMEFPGGVRFDMPRLTMPIALVDRFNNEPGSASATTLMEDLQFDMMTAYLILRKHSNRIIPFCAHLMSSSYDYKYWAHFYFRREVKQGMVSGYYKFVETMTFEHKATKDEADNTNADTDTDTNSKPSIAKFKDRITNFFKATPGRQNERGGNFEIASDEAFDFASDEDSDEDSDSSNHDGFDEEAGQPDMTQLVTRSMALQKKVQSAMMLQQMEHGSIDFAVGKSDAAAGADPT
eukprot:jgi/Psemu1/261993/estExt_Genewise1Plus.C_6630020